METLPQHMNGIINTERMFAWRDRTMNILQQPENVNVKLLDMDVMIREQVIRNSDGSYTIFLNSRITWEAQMLAYRHALGHIINGDFEKESADHIEFVSHYT